MSAFLPSRRGILDYHAFWHWMHFASFLQLVELICFVVGQIPVFYFPLYHPSQYSPSQYNSAYYPTHEPVHYQTSSPNYHYSYGGHMRYYYYGGGPYHSSLHYPPSSPMLTPSPTMSTIPLYTQSSTMTPSTGSPTDSPVSFTSSFFNNFTSPLLPISIVGNAWDLYIKVKSAC